MDGMSGTGYGTVVTSTSLRITAIGGPLASYKMADMIELNAPGETINASDLPKKKMATRKAAFKPKSFL